MLAKTESQLAQPRWATKLLASPHRGGAQANTISETQALQEVPAFPDFQDSNSASVSVSNVHVQALPAAPAGVSAEVWTAMGMMFDVKYAPLQQNLAQLNTAMVELQQFAVHKNELAQTNSDVREVSVNVTELSQLAVCHSDRIGNLERALSDLRAKLYKFELKSNEAQTMHSSGLYSLDCKICHMKNVSNI